MTPRLNWANRGKETVLTQNLHIKEAGAQSHQASRPGKNGKGARRRPLSPPPNYTRIPILGWYTRGQVMAGVLKLIGWLVVVALLLAGLHVVAYASSADEVAHLYCAPGDPAIAARKAAERDM